MNNDNLRRVTLAIGRGYEQSTQRVEIAFRGHHVKALKPIPDSHALTVGADVISQSFLLSVAIALLLLEYWRNDRLKRIETAQKLHEKRLRQAAKEERLLALEHRVAALEAAHVAAQRGGAAGLLRSAVASLPALGLPFSGGGAPGSSPSAAADQMPHAPQPQLDSAPKCSNAGLAPGGSVHVVHAEASGTPSRSAAAAAAVDIASVCKELDLAEGTFASWLAPDAAAAAARAAWVAATVRIDLGTDSAAADRATLR